MIIAQNKTSTTRIDSLDSKIWNEKRDIKIFIPQEYYDIDAKLPIIFVLDGQSSEMFNYCSGLVDYLISTNAIQPSIVVGISSYDRIFEFTPVPQRPLVES